MPVIRILPPAAVVLCGAAYVAAQRIKNTRAQQEQKNNKKHVGY
jgi:hypothetical protein